MQAVGHEIRRESLNFALFAVGALGNNSRAGAGLVSLSSRVRPLHDPSGVPRTEGIRAAGESKRKYLEVRSWTSEPWEMLYATRVNRCFASGDIMVRDGKRMERLGPIGAGKSVGFRRQRR